MNRDRNLLQIGADAAAEEPGPRICVCMKVHRETLRQAFLAGARSVEDLREATRAGGGCGTCRVDLIELLVEWGGEEP